MILTYLTSNNKCKAANNQSAVAEKMDEVWVRLEPYSRLSTGLTWVKAERIFMVDKSISVHSDDFAESKIG